jgi:hypothetical protein
MTTEQNTNIARGANPDLAVHGAPHRLTVVALCNAARTLIQTEKKKKPKQNTSQRPAVPAPSSLYTMPPILYGDSAVQCCRDSLLN